MATNLTSTTLTALVNSGPSPQNIVTLTSVTGIAAPTAGGGIQTMLLIDTEFMAVQAVNTVTLQVTVQRGMAGTKAQNHGNGATVWYGAPQYFPQFAGVTVPSSQGRYRFFTTTGIQGSLTGLGTSTANTAGGLYIADLRVDRLMVSTGGAVLNGATVGTDSPAVYLYDYSGTLIASSAAALAAGASAFQQRAWLQPVILIAGQYFLVYQTVGTTANFQTIKTATWVDVVTATATGTAGSPPANITVPTTFTADVGVIGYVY